MAVTCFNDKLNLKLFKNTTPCYLQPNEYDLQTTINKLSDSGITGHWNIVGHKSHAKDIQSIPKKLLLALVEIIYV